MEVADVLQNVLIESRHKFDSIDLKSQVELVPKFAVETNITGYSRENTSYQKGQKICTKSSENAQYISCMTKSVGSGRQVNFKDQGKFIIEMIKVQWETRHPLSKADAYMFLIKEYSSCSLIPDVHALLIWSGAASWVWLMMYPLPILLVLLLMIGAK
jgi:hypothetical protein